ncbi:MAG: glycosyltransferase N-terminal domain-containing protein [Opitutae bacterium]
MILLYRLAFPVVALLSSPYFLYRMLRRGGYGFKLHYRLGLFPRLKAKNKERKRIWIQAVSVGELSSLAKVMEVLLKDSNIEIVLTGTTSTGLLMASQKYHNLVLAQGPFPMDWWVFSRLAWWRIQPDLIITVDSELWPEHFYQASLRGVPALIINARLSDRTFSRLCGSAMARRLLLPKGLEILTTSERQCTRWIEIGITAPHIQVVGNLKVDAVSSSAPSDTCPEHLRKEFGFAQESIVIAGISTWPGEEELLVEAMEQVRNEQIDARILLIPRHAERRKKISSMLEQKGVSYHLRTLGHQAPPGTLVYLADTTGELSTLIQCADLALGGKTLPPNRGGQNPIEPIAHGIPLVLGPNFQNFHQTCGDLLIHDAIRTTESAEEAKKELINLALSAEERKQLSLQALNWMDSQGSPSEQTIEKIYSLLSS